MLFHQSRKLKVHDFGSTFQIPNCLSCLSVNICSQCVQFACTLCVLPLQVELIRRDYVANNGWETFLSYEDPEQGEASWRCGIVAVSEYKLLTASDVLAGSIRILRYTLVTVVVAGLIFPVL